jgi:Putative polyhydroxyalkanoic acid system protein (PHA_gran_rgn)
MSETVSVEVKHSLGASGAKRRVEVGIEQFRRTFGSKMSMIEEHWVDHHLNFRLGFMGHTCAGNLDIYDAYVRLEVELPGALGFFAKKVSSLVRKKGHLLLEKH